MANVILIRPISESWTGELYKRSITIPHGPLALAAHLIEKGFTASIIDEIAMTKVINNKVSDNVQKRLFEELKKETPITVGITSMTGEQIRRGKIFASLIKKYNPNIPIVWGGAHPSLLPETTVRDEHVDIVVKGEGDISFPILVSELKKNGTGDMSKVPGICYIDKNNNIISTKQPPLYRMDDMPEFPYDLIDMELYIKGIKKKFVSRYFEINSSRGCPYKCSFCLNSKEGIPYTKARSSRIIQEIVTLKNKYNIDGIYFNDENFILNKKRIKEIADAAINLNLNMRFRGSGRCELFLKFDDEYLQLFKRAGFYHFGLGVESGSNKTLRSINKQITTGEIYSVVNKLVQYKFEATYNFIAGFPHETIDDYKETLRTIHDIFKKCTYMVYPIPAPSYFCPLPGTKSFDDAVKLGHQIPVTLTDWEDVDYNISDMAWISKDLHKFITESRKVINEINKKFIGEGAMITQSDFAPLRKIMQ
tara:strand:+ start:2614 stop:4050 length:1437 start_codon:yes stop_codon:yes gene_type:complete